MTTRDWLADRLTRLAASRLKRRYPDWAEALLNENQHLAGERDRLGWAFGALRASLAALTPDLFYPAVLILAIGAMALYQWSADEGVLTLVMLGSLGACLGFLRPKHFLLSGLVLGAVVAGVNGFESLSGIRPAYEIYPRTLMHSLRWLVLVIPALVSSAMGRQVGLKLLA